MEIELKKINPDGNSGWSFEYSLIDKIARLTHEMDDDDYCCMEQVHNVLLALYQIAESEAGNE